MSDGSNLAEDYLRRFMKLFGVNNFELLSSSASSISARVSWEDESTESQEIQWEVQKFENIEAALDLGESLKSQKLLSNDQILATPEEVIMGSSLGDEAAVDAMETLVSIKVHMIEDGEKADSFFLHF